MKAKAKFDSIIDGNRFVYTPVGDDDFKSMHKMQEYINLENRTERDIEMHRKYFALVKATIHHTNEALTLRFGTINKMRKQLMIMSGNCNTIENVDGTINYEAHSIKFKNMDENKFKQVYKDCLDAAVHFFLKEISFEDFKSDIANFY